MDTFIHLTNPMDPKPRQSPAWIDRRKSLMLPSFALPNADFHQASMHDISAEAGISVGLIYRYFENKEAVISAMADRHKKEIQEILERPSSAQFARIAGNSFYRALLRGRPSNYGRVRGRIFLTEASRNHGIAELVRDVTRTAWKA